MRPESRPAAKLFGDLGDLVASIKDKGSSSRSWFVPPAKKFQIIAGERRYRASMEAGLSQIPCIELDVDDGESLKSASSKTFNASTSIHLKRPRAF